MYLLSLVSAATRWEQQMSVIDRVVCRRLSNGDGDVTAGFAYFTAPGHAASAVIPSSNIALRTQKIHACALGTGTFRKSPTECGGVSAGDLAGRKAAGEAWWEYAQADPYTEDIGALIQRRGGEVR